ncbi:DUF262 domain-containing protein [Nostoc punctiforme UO1]|uniref:DUF262 domain-containing protein n=1 Tax=Nostoc punctiforme TaxID=272131 RepID=UPI0030AD6C01
MDTQLQSLSKIFTERLFRIPDYQRGYAWEQKQLREFWSDINQLEPGKNHYTGVLTLESVPEDLYKKWEADLWIIDARSFQPFYIVDGQQRLTTSIILIQAILEHIGAETRLNFTHSRDIQKKFIFDSKDDDSISKSYIFGYEQDNPSYEYLKTYVFGDYSTTASDFKETIYTQNLERAKLFFKERLEGFSHDDLGILYKKVTQQLLFNIFTIAEEVDVCVAFETMNNRGKPLSYLELLKNRLIYLSLKLQDSDYEKKALRRTINDCWKAIYHNLGRNKSKPLDDDQFLSAHYLLYFGNNSYNPDETEEQTRPVRMYRPDYSSFLLEYWFVQRNIADDIPLKQRVTLKRIHDYVISLQFCVETWYKLFNPLESELDDEIKIWLDKINRIGIDVLAPLILNFFIKEVSGNQRKEFLRNLERFAFINMLLRRGSHTPNLRQKVLLWTRRISGSVKPSKIISDIEQASNELFNAKYYMESMVEMFRDVGFYKWVGIRYFLFEYNLYLQENSKTNRQKIVWPEFNENKEDFVTVEHIFPKTADDEYWKSRFGHCSSKLKSRLCDSLGNLLPLSRPKNSSLQNKPFPDKVAGNGLSCVGYRYGCYAENEVCGYAEWNPQAIVNRGLKLINFMEERWKIPIDDQSKRLFLLGLEELKETDNNEV